MDIELAQALAENELLKSLLYCTKRSCNNCGKVNCENFQRQRKDCCENWVSYKDYIKELEQKNHAMLVNSLKICNQSEIDNDENERKIAELEEKISVLLSCKNCPENKGGYICEKEYENKCLSQKIQFIKELQEENAEAKNLIEELASSLSVVGNCDEEECELINKAQKFINKPIF